MFKMAASKWPLKMAAQSDCLEWLLTPAALQNFYSKLLLPNGCSKWLLKTAVQNCCSAWLLVGTVSATFAACFFITEGAFPRTDFVNCTIASAGAQDTDTRRHTHMHRHTGGTVTLATSIKSDCTRKQMQVPQWREHRGTSLFCWRGIYDLKK